MPEVTKGGGKRVLLVSYYFPPCNMVASLRTYSFGRYLAEAGHQVTVLTMDFTGTGMDLDLDLDLDCHGFVVERVTGGGKGVKNIDYYGRRAHDRDGSSRPLWRLLSGAVRRGAQLKNALLGNLATPEDLWFPRALRLARKLAGERGFEVLVTSQGPITSHLIGLRVKTERPGLLWIADYRDPWSNNANFPAPKWPLSRLQSWLEARINCAADHLLTVSHPLAEDYFARYREKTTVIENGYFPEELAAGAAAEAVPGMDGRFLCSYTGNFYYGKYRIEPLYQALRQLLAEGTLTSDSFRLRLCGSNLYQLEKTLPGDLSGLVKFSNSVPRRESLKIQRSSRALIFFSSDDQRYRGVYSAKIFEYLSAGAPIIVIGNGGDNCAAELVEAAGAGFVCGDDVEKIVAAFTRIAKGDLPRRNDEVIASFSRKRLADRLLALIECGNGSTGGCSQTGAPAGESAGGGL